MVYLLDQLDYDSLTNPKTDMRHSIGDTSTLLLDRRSIPREVLWTAGSPRNCGTSAAARHVGTEPRIDPALAVPCVHG